MENQPRLPKKDAKRAIHKRFALFSPRQDKNPAQPTEDTPESEAVNPPTSEPTGGTIIPFTPPLARQCRHPPVTGNHKNSKANPH